MVVSDRGMVEEYAHISLEASQLIEAFWPGPLTLILEKKKEIYNSPSGTFDFVALQLPDSTFSQLMSKESGVPITTPSANKAAGETPYTLETVVDSFGEENGEIVFLLMRDG